MRFVRLTTSLTVIGLVLVAAAAAHADTGEECLRGKSPEIQISACTTLLNSAELTPRDRALVHHFRGRAHDGRKDIAKALIDYNEVLGTKAKDLEPRFIEATVASVILIVNDDQKLRERGIGAEVWARVMAWGKLNYNPANLE